jgi:NO-binding membrane sensor protein with MHYT domain/two-component sensor histidine kinase
MIATYDYWLVLLSVVVAVNASFVALDLASRVAAYEGQRTARYWLAGGAISIGTGIWSMHFIGMLAYRLPTPLSYDVGITLLSLAIAILTAGFALYWASRAVMNLYRLLGGALLMGVGIASMHYAGMAAMRMEPPIRYEPWLFSLSLLIAVAASAVALFCTSRMRSDTILSAFWRKVGSALIMGSAIYGMHYTAMAAADIAPDSVCMASPQNINAAWLASALGGFTLLFLVATILVAAFDAHLAELLRTRVAERTAELHRTSKELRQCLGRLAESQDEERRLLAAELHEIVGQNLSALNAELALIRSQLPPEAAGELSDKLTNATALIKQGVHAVRNVMAQLRPPDLDELGLPAALRWHAAALESRAGVAVTVDADEKIPRPSPKVENVVLRVYMEALTNVSKHAGASTVSVTLETGEGHVVMKVVDDGRGFDASRASRRDDTSGWGLILMRERAASVEGEFCVHSAPGAGTRIEFRISRDKWS